MKKEQNNLSNKENKEKKRKNEKELREKNKREQIHFLKRRNKLLKDRSKLKT
jgi:hypothetical protein